MVAAPICQRFLEVIEQEGNERNVNRPSLGASFVGFILLRAFLWHSVFRLSCSGCRLALPLAFVPSAFGAFVKEPWDLYNMHIWHQSQGNSYKIGCFPYDFCYIISVTYESH